jgi:hypothetical protein
MSAPPGPPKWPGQAPDGGWNPFEAKGEVVFDVAPHMMVVQDIHFDNVKNCLVSSLFLLFRSTLDGPSPCMPPPDVWKKISERRNEVVAFLKTADQENAAVREFLLYYPHLK